LYLGTVPNAAEKKFCFLHVINEAVFGNTFHTLELHRFYHADSMLAFSARLEKQAPEDDKKGHNLIAS
jgi:hypothetical protein